MHVSKKLLRSSQSMDDVADVHISQEIPGNIKQKEMIPLGL